MVLGEWRAEPGCPQRLWPCQESGGFERIFGLVFSFGFGGDSFGGLGFFWIWVFGFLERGLGAFLWGWGF